MQWTPNKITLLRVGVGFAAVSLFGRSGRANLAAVALTVAAIALDALDGHIARRKNLASPVGAQPDILGDRVIENVYFTYFAVVGMVSLWLPVFFFARGAATDFLRGLAAKAGRPGWGANAMLTTPLGHALVLVSGALEPLANVAARVLEAELRERGCEAAVHVCATRLEESAGRWTGRILGEPMVGAEKARAARQWAETEDFDLWRCYAYGNSSDDRWLLASAGHATAVNPSWRLARVAGRAGWMMVHWKKEGAAPCFASLDSARDRQTGPKYSDAKKHLKERKQLPM